MKPQIFEAARREFLVKTAAVSGGLMLGVNLSGTVVAADGSAPPEVTRSEERRVGKECRL